MNDYIAGHGHGIPAIVDSTLSWRTGQTLPMTRCVFIGGPPKYSFSELARLYRDRQAAEIGEQLQSKEISIQEANEALGELIHQTAGRNGELSMLTPSQILAWDDDPSDLVLANGYLEEERMRRLRPAGDREEPVCPATGGQNRPRAPIPRLADARHGPEMGVLSKREFDAPAESRSRGHDDKFYEQADRHN